MSRTLGQLLTDVQTRLDETVARFWTTPELRGWILEGARDIARRAETNLAGPLTIPVTQGQQQYPAPVDTIRVFRVEWQPTSGSGTSIYPLEYRDLSSMDAVWGISQKITQGYPVVFSMWGFPPNLNLILYPTPSANGQINVYYYRLPIDLPTDGTQDNQAVDIPEGWYDLLSQYAEYIALRKDGDPRWQDARQMYEENLGNLIDVTRRWTDQAGQMEYQGQVLPGWLYGSDETGGGW